MRAFRIMANLQVDDLETAKGFYRDFLGLSTQEFDLGWVTRLTSPDGAARVQLVTRDASSPVDSVASVQVDDVQEAYERALELGYEIVRPLNVEEWGVHRFLVRAPDGNVLNIVGHPDERP